MGDRAERQPVPPKGSARVPSFSPHSLTLDQLDLGALPPWLKLAYRSFTGKGSFSLELSTFVNLCNLFLIKKVFFAKFTGLWS